MHGGTRAPTVRQTHTVEAVRAHYARFGRPPSYKEIGVALGIASTGYVDRLVKSCERLGTLCVVRRKGQRTEIRLTSPLAEIATAALIDELASRRATAETVALGENDGADSAMPLAA